MSDEKIQFTGRLGVCPTCKHPLMIRDGALVSTFGVTASSVDGVVVVTPHSYECVDYQERVQ